MRTKPPSGRRTRISLIGVVSVCAISIRQFDSSGQRVCLCSLLMLKRKTINRNKKKQKKKLNKTNVQCGGEAVQHSH